MQNMLLSVAECYRLADHRELGLSPPVKGEMYWWKTFGEDYRRGRFVGMDNGTYIMRVKTADERFVEIGV